MKTNKGINSEYIICAAIWYKDLPSQTFLPKNIEYGMIVCGYRHPHCIDIVKILSGLRTVQIAPDGVGSTITGFLTNTNKFVNREEAAHIAYLAGQISEPSDKLFSEDIY